MSSKLFKQIDSSVLEFCDIVAKKYKLNQTELFKLWNGDDFSVSSKSKESSDVEPAMELTREKILSSTKDVLMAFCKSKNVKQSGKKEEIIERLLGLLNDDTKVESKPVQSKSVKSAASMPAVLIKVAEKVGTPEIRKNKFGNYEHFESGIVFNNETKMAIGHQNTTGKVDSLTDNDIETCKKYKFKYTLPENLSVDKGLNNVKVEDVDDVDDEDELDEDDIEEEEEDLEAEVDLEED